MNRESCPNKRHSQSMMNKAIRGVQKLDRIHWIDGYSEVNLVGARILDVARLLATVANTLGRGLRRAVAGQVSDLST